LKTILCYGDSNTYGYDPRNGLRYPEEIRWTCRLKKLLGDEYRVIEEGCNGRTTVFDDPAESWKNGRTYLPACLNSHKPVDIVILMLGSNDLKKIYNKSAEEIAEGAGTLAEDILSFTPVKQGYAPAVILVSPPEIGEGIGSSPFRDRFGSEAVKKSREFPPLYRKTAEKHGCIFFNAAEYIKPSEMDSLHLDPEAHEILAEELFRAVRAIG